MGKKHLSERNLGFETLQLHVGQEEADPVTDARAVPIYATSTEDLPIRPRMYLKKELQH